MRRLVWIFLLLTIPVWGQDSEPEEAAEAGGEEGVDTIVVDRPSFGFPSFIVGENITTLESGVLVTQGKGSSQALVTTPQILRHGVSDDFELRLTTSGLNFHSGQAGWSDLTPGFKWRFVDEEEASVSLLTALSIPAGSSKFRSDAVSGAVTLCADFPVTEEAGVLVNVGANTTGNSGRNDVIVGFVTCGIAQPLSEDLTIYIEMAGFTPQEVGGPSTLAGDIVLAYLVNPDLQLDIAGYKGFSSSGLDWGATLGVSTRF